MQTALNMAASTTSIYDTCVKTDGHFGSSADGPTFCIMRGSCPQPPVVTRRNMEFKQVFKVEGESAVAKPKSRLSVAE